MNVLDFIAKWRRVELGERQASQQHFLDLCAVVGHPTPAEADPVGESFCFERGAARLDGSNGWADVWKRGCFGWEYKGKHKDLDAAYRQLLLYREDSTTRSEAKGREQGRGKGGRSKPAAPGGLRHGPHPGPHALAKRVAEGGLGRA